VSAWDRQSVPAKGMPHGFIEWKDTKVSMDVTCQCGAEGHIKAINAYHVKCNSCGAVYFCNGHIELIRLTDDEIAKEASDSIIGFDDEEDAHLMPANEYMPSGHLIPQVAA
jgi:hypothetical protein